MMCSMSLILRQYIKDSDHMVNDEVSELTPDLSYVEQPIQILEQREREIRRKKFPWSKCFGITTLCEMRCGNQNWRRGRHIRSFSKVHCNFEDEIIFEEGRVVTPSFCMPREQEMFGAREWILRTISERF
jgi:hypothetical protein